MNYKEECEMPVPQELKSGNERVFKYAENLSAACQKLESRLNDGIIIEVTIGEVETTLTNIEKAKNGKVAWLVGHGSARSSSVYSEERGISIQVIIDWLKNNNYTHVVDTCCSPNLRRRAKMRGMKYYCASDSRVVSENQNYETLDAWWEDNGFNEI